MAFLFEAMKQNKTLQLLNIQYCQSFIPAKDPNTKVYFNKYRLDEIPRIVWRDPSDRSPLRKPPVRYEFKVSCK
jgi:hypothetical protein